MNYIQIGHSIDGNLRISEQEYKSLSTLLNAKYEGTTHEHSYKIVSSIPNNNYKICVANIIEKRNNEDLIFYERPTWSVLLSKCYVKSCDKDASNAYFTLSLICNPWKSAMYSREFIATNGIKRAKWLMQALKLDA